MLFAKPSPDTVFSRSRREIAKISFQCIMFAQNSDFEEFLKAVKIDFESRRFLKTSTTVLSRISEATFGKN